MVHLYRFHLKRHARGALLLAVAFMLLCTGAVLLFDEGTIALLSEARANNAPLAAALGLGSSEWLVTHLASLVYGLLLPLIGSLYAMRLSAMLIADKIETGEVAHYLALPIRREQFVFSQTLVLLTCLLFPVFGALLGGYGAALAFKPGAVIHPAGILWLSAGLYAVMVLFGCLGLMLSCGAVERRVMVLAGTFICLLLFALGLLAQPLGLPEQLRYLSFYWLYAPQALAVGRPAPALAALPLVSLLFVLIGSWRFATRDLE